MTSPLKAPFPAFGGKSRVAGTVWPRLSVADRPARNYIEPFCFSAAMLLLRQDEPQIETVNDLNAFVANFWRAIKGDPAAVASHADWPVNETDLHARHAWLVRSHEAAERLQKVRDDAEYFDAKIAGWWCWGACMWIGSGWCEERTVDNQQRPHFAEGSAYGQGVNAKPDLSQKIPILRGGTNQGVNADSPDKRPQLCNGNTAYGQGVHKKPILTSDGGTGDKGINSLVNLEQQGGLAVSPGLGNQGIYLRGDGKGNGIARPPSGDNRPQLADAYSRGRGVHGNDNLSDCERRHLWLLDWFMKLSNRLRSVRVCCGHWNRVCDSPSTLTRLGTTAVFLDPPYRKKLADGTENRAGHIYANDKSQDVDAMVDEVQAWCLKWGEDPELRIAVCGLEGEYPELEHWEKFAWKGQGGYGNRNLNNDNAARERIWFSPHCIPADRQQQRSLFAESA